MEMLDQRLKLVELHLAASPLALRHGKRVRIEAVRVLDAIVVELVVGFVLISLGFRRGEVEGRGAGASRRMDGWRRGEGGERRGGARLRARMAVRHLRKDGMSAEFAVWEVPVSFCKADVTRPAFSLGCERCPTRGAKESARTPYPANQDCFAAVRTPQKEAERLSPRSCSPATSRHALVGSARQARIP